MDEETRNLVWDFYIAGFNSSNRDFNGDTVSRKFHHHQNHGDNFAEWYQEITEQPYE